MDLPQPGFRSLCYLVAQRVIACPFCGMRTRVAAVALPIGHEVLEDQEERGQEQGLGLGTGWQAVAGNALLFFIAQLPGGAAEHLRQQAPGFGLTSNLATHEIHWANHCEHCKALLDDNALHCEPGDSFVPISEAQGTRIRLTEINEPIEGSASGYALEPQFVPFKRRL
jgi:hypothetical protein